MDDSKKEKRGGQRQRPTSPLWGGRDRERSGGVAGGSKKKRSTPTPDRRSDPPHKGEGGGERIAKRLARAGISSRREAEALIAAGRVRVNGVVLSSPAFNVGPQDRIEVDGTPIPTIERTRLFLFHKPAGVVTTNHDPEGRRTIFDCLPSGLPRLVTVGRLDMNTEGLLLLTNDGGLARVLELPSTGWLRRYRARVHGKVEAEALGSLREGIAVDGVFYGAVEATLDREQGSNAWLTIGLREGKNREVKNILGALGLEVTRLIRVSYGPFQLGELGEGEVLELKGRLLRDQLGERLIAEAGANFEAPVARPFSNKPVRAGQEPKAAKPRNAAPRIEEGGLIRNRKKAREDRREEALDRLQTTRPSRFEKKRSEEKNRPEDKKRDAPARPRSSNVWMAPGARPVGKGKAAEAANIDKTKSTKKGRGQSPSSGPSGHLLPGGEKRQTSRPATSSPRRGEGGPRSGPGEGAKRNRPGPKGPRRPPKKN